MVEMINEARSGMLIPIDDLIHLREAGIPNAEIAERELRLDRIESLKARDPEEWPAILVTRTSIGSIVIDGYHRIAAALALCRKKFRSEVRPFPNINEMVEEAWRAHRDHREPLSAESRSAYAWWLRITYPEMEQIETAKRARISQPTVSKVIKRHYEKMRVHQARHVLMSAEELLQTVFRQKCNKVMDSAWSVYEDLRQLLEEEQRVLLSMALSEEDRAMLIALLEMLKKLSSPD